MSSRRVCLYPFQFRGSDLTVPFLNLVCLSSMAVSLPGIYGDAWSMCRGGLGKRLILVCLQLGRLGYRDIKVAWCLMVTSICIQSKLRLLIERGSWCLVICRYVDGALWLVLTEFIHRYIVFDFCM